jgi:hypothetical protein
MATTCAICGRWKETPLRRDEYGGYICLHCLEQKLDELQQIKESLMEKPNIENLFSYHAPKNDQPARYEMIRSVAKVMAQVIINCTPECSDQTAAIRKLRECVMTANAAIACNE